MGLDIEILAQVLQFCLILPNFAYSFVPISRAAIFFEDFYRITNDFGYYPISEQKIGPRISFAHRIGKQCALVTN